MDYAADFMEHPSIGAIKHYRMEKETFRFEPVNCYYFQRNSYYFRSYYFQSYLSGRYQKVCVDGKLSEPLGIHSGVPQGSILGPALFLLFINDLPLALKNNIGIYADDSTFLCICTYLS